MTSQRNAELAPSITRHGLGVTVDSRMATGPARVDYELTEMGRDVLIPVTALATWAFIHRSKVEIARSVYDRLQTPTEDAPHR